MHQYSLKFIDLLLEDHYQHKNTRYQTQIFSTFLIFQFFYLCFLAVISIVKCPKKYNHIIIFSLSSIFLAILWRIRLKFTKLFKIGLQIFFLGFGLVLTELSQIILISDKWLIQETVAFLIPIQGFLSLMLLMRMNWMLSSSIYFLNLVYFLIRIVNIDSDGTHFYIWISLIMGVLNFSYMAFREQKSYRELFKTTHDSYETLNLYHLLLRNVLPSSIFILNYGKDNTPTIEFINFQALKLMNKTLGENYFYSNSRCIDCSLNFPNHAVKSCFSSDHEIDYDKINDFLGKMSVLDQKFEEYHNNIPLILADHFNSKKLIPFIFRQKNQKNRKHGDVIISEQSKLLNRDTDVDEIQPSSSGMEKKIKYYELKGAKIRWNEKDCLLVLLSDITKSKKIIELKNLDKHKNELLASVSHDLRTPLNGVIGMINATMGEVRDDKLKDFLLVALRSANLLDFLIKDILDFSQMSYKQLRLNIEEFDMKTVVQEVFSLMKFQARARPINLELDLDIPERLICKSDPNRLKQILINLLGNAIKFTKQGFIKLQMQFTFDQERKLIKFSVSDTGIGIRKEDQPKLFRLFGKLSQEDPEINKHGIGLGLAISNSLAKLLAPISEDSGLHVESSFGQGSTFWFYVDVGSIESPMKKPVLTILESSSSVEVKFPSFDKAKPLVLIVDDDMVNLFVLEKYLEILQIDVLRAMNGVEAVEIVEREVVNGKKKLALILMDCHMPLMNGLKATELIINVLVEAKKEMIPIVGISANDSQEEVENCLKAGMIKFIGKPIKREEFYKLIEGILEKERVIE